MRLDFEGAEAVAAGEEFIDELPYEEFRIPGQLIADATVREVDHRFGAYERLVVTALLLLEEGDSPVPPPSHPRLRGDGHRVLGWLEVLLTKYPILFA